MSHEPAALKCQACGQPVSSSSTLSSGKPKCCGLFARHQRRRTDQIRPRLHLVRVQDQRSDLRKAFEAGCSPGIQLALQVKCTLSESGCWLYPRTGKDGYGRVRIGKSDVAAHRIAAGNPPSHHVVHHTCAVRNCCNPDHLQVVSPAENAAEMLERQSYLQRINELENALQEMDPNHHLLNPQSKKLVSP